MSVYLYLTAILVAVWLLFKWTSSYWLRLGCRGPAGIPLFGSMYQYFMMRKHFGVIYDEIYKYIRTFTPITLCLAVTQTNSCFLFVLSLKKKNSSYPDAQYVGFYKFGTPSILVRSIDMARTVLVDNFSAFSNNDVHLEPKLDPLFMKNPFFCADEEWKRTRSQFGPVFSTSKVRQVQPLVFEVCDKLVRYLDERLNVELETKKVYNYNSQWEFQYARQSF